MARGRKPELKGVADGLAKAPPAPAWLPAESKTEWRRIWPGLAARRTVTTSDLATVEAYCLAVGTAKRAQAQIALDGEILATEYGPKRHPAFQTLFQSLTESRRLAAELGLTPTSRNKAGAAIPDGDDDLKDLDL
ncbi:phage terminase small subunit P27 family [Nitrospirillum amazonense]|uniref:phage terminase small subunit P27 family n=1 Tax=Nitrospirillum amazonense TaxID=28077 RepID=UPI002DD4439D|nr:phage terminase small subunit P27 family [Nitrospirillum amazonense]MEC4590563.1 phage terminase small subunit P27 family [Nitrospirillum amazonense]